MHYQISFSNLFKLIRNFYYNLFIKFIFFLRQSIIWCLLFISMLELFHRFKTCNINLCNLIKTTNQNGTVGFVAQLFFDFHISFSPFLALAGIQKALPLQGPIPNPAGNFSSLIKSFRGRMIRLNWLCPNIFFHWTILPILLSIKTDII